MTDYKEIKKTMGDLHKSITETAPEDYTLERAVSDLVCITNANMTTMNRVVEILQISLNVLTDQKATNERLQKQIDEIYCDLAPEIELIDEMSEGDPMIREMLLELYREKGGDYICELYSMRNANDANIAAETEHEKRDQQN